MSFLWRDNPNEPVKVYEYGRHIFGDKSSPTCANYALQQVARDNAQESPQSTKPLRRNFYMDDFVKSVPSAEQAIEIYNILRAMLARGGFHLTKWISNCGQTMTSIDQADKSPSTSNPSKLSRLLYQSWERNGTLTQTIWKSAETCRRRYR